MPKQRITVTQPFTIPAEITFDVEFDTETGEAYVAGDGRVTSHLDEIAKRDLVQAVEAEVFDREVYEKLLRDGALPRPAAGGSVMLSRREHRLELVDEDADPTTMDTEDLVMMLDPVEPTHSVRWLDRARQADLRRAGPIGRI